MNQANAFKHVMCSFPYYPPSSVHVCRLKSSEAYIVCLMRATCPTHLILRDTNANARYDATQHVITSGIPTLQANRSTKANGETWRSRYQPHSNIV
jgi:hypothetical protein